jgi:hypothetical protein
VVIFEYVLKNQAKIYKARRIVEWYKHERRRGLVSGTYGTKKPVHRNKDTRCECCRESEGQTMRRLYRLLTVCMARVKVIYVDGKTTPAEDSGAVSPFGDRWEVA